MRHVAELAILLLWGVSATQLQAAQPLYKSVGPDGRIIYSDRPSVDARLEKTMTFENLPSSALPASTSAYIEQLRKTAPAFSPQLATSEVALYTARWCGFCKRAKAYLGGKGVKYQEFDIESKNGMAAFARAGGARGIPLLVVGGQRVQGFSQGAYDALFANRN